jgi:hypothetical protein
MDVSIKVVAQYSHRLPISPDTKAGANERAGFIDASDTNTKKNMSKSIIAPITIPLKPLKPFVYTTTNITAISRAEANICTANIKG